MSIEIKEVIRRRNLRTFIYLPEKIHSGRKNWVPPIYMDEWVYFNPRKNRAFSYSDTILLLAYLNGKPAGRIMGIINRRYNEIRREKTARFGYLESYHNEKLVHQLLTSVEEWARNKGMNKIVGPYGFTDQDPEGFLIEGFENRATIATYYNFEWMPEIVENFGYSKDIDYYVYKIQVPKEFPEFYNRIYQRLKRKGEFKILDFQRKKEIKPWVKPILHLMNECYSNSNIYGYTSLNEEEMEHLAKRYMPILDPRFVKVVNKNDELVSFIVGIPDMTEGIQKARGRLFPFGFFHIIRAAKKTKQLDLLLGAIKENYRGRGLDVLMGTRMIRSANEAGMKVMDTHHEMESNVKVRAEMEKMGGKLYKKFRVYKKQL